MVVSLLVPQVVNWGQQEDNQVVPPHAVEDDEEDDEEDGEDDDEDDDKEDDEIYDKEDGK